MQRCIIDYFLLFIMEIQNFLFWSGYFLPIFSVLIPVVAAVRKPVLGTSHVRSVLYTVFIIYIVYHVKMCYTVTNCGVFVGLPHWAIVI